MCYTLLNSPAVICFQTASYPNKAILHTTELGQD